MMKKKVLIVDDSAFIRKLLTEIINSDPQFEVVGVAPDPTVAAEKIVSLNPDMITLDIEMPKMDGLTFLEKLMRLKPIPVLIISSLSTVNSDIAFEAMRLGAIDYIPKPAEDIAKILPELTSEIHQKLRACAYAKVTIRTTNSSKQNPKNPLDKAENRKINFKTTDKVIAIGASTGGTVALEALFKLLPVNIPGIVVVLHMPPGFTKSFANRLNDLCDLAISEAEDNEQVMAGKVLIAPGNQHLILNRSGAKYFVNIINTPPVNRHRPSVDVLFRSVAEIAGINGIGIILTGMGDDGAAGLLEMKTAGADTVGQSEKTCTVYGMPKVAFEKGAVNHVCSIEEIANYISKIKIT